MLLFWAIPYWRSLFPTNVVMINCWRDGGSYSHTRTLFKEPEVRFAPDAFLVPVSVLDVPNRSPTATIQAFLPRHKRRLLRSKVISAAARPATTVRTVSAVNFPSQHCAPSETPPTHCVHLPCTTTSSWAGWDCSHLGSLSLETLHASQQ
jgi:hypothetical protein